MVVQEPHGLPTMGNRLTRLAGRAIISSIGWKISGKLPDCPKCVAILAPHTSNWDFVISMGALLKLGLRVAWMGKSKMFKWPVKRLFLALGGIPIDREAASGIVGQYVGEFNRRKKMILAMAPEGTRDAVKRWKTGFYHIALGAQVPIVFIGLDYGSKQVALSPLFFPSGDIDRDTAVIKDHFARFKAKNPVD